MRSWLKKIVCRKHVLWSVNEGQYGLCDRIRGLACGLAWAQAQRRVLHYRWQPNELCPANFSDLFELPPQARIGPDVVGQKPGDVVSLRLGANPQPHHFWRYLEEHQLGTHPFASLDGFKEAWKGQVQRLRPVPKIRNSIRQCLRAADKRQMIGLHLRRTDVVGSAAKPEIHSGNLDAHEATMLRSVRSLATLHRGSCFFLASDERASFVRWAEILSAERIPLLIHHKEWTSEFRQSHMADAVVDLWMLGACEQVLGTVHSGFLLIAEALGSKARLLKVVSH